MNEGKNYIARTLNEQLSGLGQIGVPYSEVLDPNQARISRDRLHFLYHIAEEVVGLMTVKGVRPDEGYQVRNFVDLIWVAPIESSNIEARQVHPETRAGDGNAAAADYAGKRI